MKDLPGEGPWHPIDFNHPLFNAELAQEPVRVRSRWVSTPTWWQGKPASMSLRSFSMGWFMGLLCSGGRFWAGVWFLTGRIMPS